MIYIKIIYIYILDYPIYKYISIYTYIYIYIYIEYLHILTYIDIQRRHMTTVFTGVLTQMKRITYHAH